jgi:hypothetical protein
MAAAKLEYVPLRRWADDVDNATGVLFLIERLEHHVVASLFLILNKLELVLAVLYHQRVGLLTDFAFEGLPKVG